MRRTGIFFICLLAASAQQSNPARVPQLERPGSLMSGSMTTLRNGVGIKVAYNTVVEPPEKQSSVRITGGSYGFDKQNVVHRYMVDPVHDQYFGYDLAVAPGLSPGHFTITISPLSMGPKEFGMGGSKGNPDSLRPVPLPTYPPPQDVQEGDTVALDLLVSADGAMKLVDYFQVWSEGSDGPSAATTGAEPRDYTVDDGAPHFIFDGTKVLVNGQPSDLAGSTTKPGATLWLAAPNQGRYILSLVPHDGFQKSGVIRDNMISFQADGQHYEIRTPGLILGTRGA